MDRGWIRWGLWALLFAGAVVLSSRMRRTPSGASIGELFGFGASVHLVQQQAHLTDEERNARANQKQLPAITSQSTPGPALGLEELGTTLREDRLCEFVRLHPDKMLVQQVLLTTFQSRLLSGLFGPHGPMSGAPDYGSTDEITLFFNALVAGKLLGGVGSAGGSDPAAFDGGYAEKLFRELETRDPSNGAYFYFHAHLLAKSGRPLAEQHQLLLKALDTAKFNTFIPLIWSEFQKGATQNATFWLAAVNHISVTPFPSYPSGKAMSALLNEDPLPVHQKAVDFAMVLLNQPKALQIERLSAIDLLENSWPRVHPRERLPDLKKKIRLPERPQEAAEWMAALKALEAEPCDRSAFDQYYLKHRSEDLPIR